MQDKKYIYVLVYDVAKNEYSISHSAIEEEAQRHYQLKGRKAPLLKESVDTEQAYLGRYYFSSMTKLTEFIKRDMLSKEYSFQYQLLDRLKADCEYAIASNSLSCLWGKDLKSHIQEMMNQLASIPEEAAPSWLTFDDIYTYEHRLSAIALAAASKR